MEQMLVYRLLRVEKATHLFTNAIPQIIFAELVIRGNSSKLHETPIRLRPGGRDEFVGGRPVDQLGTATTGTRQTGKIKVGLELGDIVWRGLRRRNARGGVVVGPESVNVGVGLASLSADYTFVVELFRPDMNLQAFLDGVILH